MNISFIEIIKNQALPFFNFYCLTGEDHFAHKLVLKKLVKKYIPQDLEEFNYNTIEINKDKQTSELITCVLSYPVFSDHKIIYIKNADLLTKDAVASVVNNLKQMPQKNIAIFSLDSVSSKNALDAYLKKNGCIIKCVLSENELAEYVKVKFKENKVDIKNDIVYYLISKTGNNLGLVDIESEKLIAHSHAGHSHAAHSHAGHPHGNAHVTKTSIDNLVTQNTFAKIYHLSDFISKKNLKESISMVEILAREEGDEFIYTVLGYLNKHFKTLLSIKTMLKKNISVDKISAALGIKSEYYFKNCMRQAGNFTVDELVKYFDYLQKADFNIKNSQDPVLTIELMLASICK